MPLTSDDEIRELLTEARTVAVFGCSDRPDRPSYGVAAFLQRHGYRILPVNPQITGERVHQEFVWRDLSQIGVSIDIVDIFRRPIAAAEAVDQAIAVGAKAVWMQLGIVNEEAAAKAEAAGLKVVMDRCTKIEIMRLGVPRIALFDADRIGGSVGVVFDRPARSDGTGKQDARKVRRSHRRP